MPKDPCRLYLVTPPRLDPEAFGEQLRAALGGGDVACLQLRLKDCTDTDILRAAEALLPICQSFDVPLLINDRPDLAAICGAEGAHVGQEDASYTEAREILGADAIVGVTCHNSRHLAISAAESGADYVAFGAFFETGTKAPKTRASVDILEWWNDLMVVPSVAIGGITPSNCAPLVKAGVNFLAAVSAVWNHEGGPQAGVADFNKAIEAALADNKNDVAGRPQDHHRIN